MIVPGRWDGVWCVLGYSWFYFISFKDTVSIWLKVWQIANIFFKMLANILFKCHFSPSPFHPIPQ